MSWLFDLPDWFVLVLAAVAWYFWALAKRLLERRKQSWPVVEGRIAANYVMTEMEKDIRQMPELCYSYEVSGQRYYGVQKVFEFEFDTYPPDSPILVHYNPSNPSASRLDIKDMRERADAFNVIDQA